VAYYVSLMKTDAAKMLRALETQATADLSTLMARGQDPAFKLAELAGIRAALATT